MTRTVLIAGMGAFGALHAQAWRDIAGVRVRMMDPDATARSRATALGLAEDAVFNTLEAALIGADIVDVVTSPATHMQVAQAAIARGLPVLIEKPATRTVAEAHALRAMAGPVPVQVGLILRAHPLTLQARDILSGGGIGRLLTISGDFSGWKRMRDDSDLIENDGVHFLDLMRHLGQSPIEAVDATSQACLGGTRPDDIRIDTRLANGVTGELRLGLLRGGDIADSVVPGAMTRKVLTLCGDAGILELDFNRDRLTHSTVAYRSTPGGWHPEPGATERTSLPPATPDRLLRASFKHFLTAVDAGQSPMCDLTEGAVELSQVCEAVAVALARGARPPVRVADRMEATG